jgi:hypothetical protein
VIGHFLASCIIIRTYSVPGHITFHQSIIFDVNPDSGLSALTMESCCTCATILSATPQYSAEKPLPDHRRVACCSRIICGNCIQVRLNIVASTQNRQGTFADAVFYRGTSDSPATVRTAKYLLSHLPCRRVSRTRLPTCQFCLHLRRPPSKPRSRHHTAQPVPHYRCPMSTMKRQRWSLPTRKMMPRIHCISSTTTTIRSRPCPSDTTSQQWYCAGPITSPVITSCRGDELF